MRCGESLAQHTHTPIASFLDAFSDASRALAVVLLQVSHKYGLIYVVTKLGLLFVYDLETATAVYRNRISPDPFFLACASDSTGGFYAINRCGWVDGGILRC